jgi:competence protein ComEC
MSPSRRVRRPAAVLGLALLAGTALAGAAPGLTGAWLWLGLLMAALLVAPLHAGEARRSIALMALCGTAGWWVGVRALREPGFEWVPGHGRYAALHIEGRVLGAAETRADGERRIEVEARLSRGRGSESARVSLRIRTASDEWGRQVDALRRGDRIRTWARVGLPRRRDPSEVDPVRALQARGIDATGSVKSAGLIERVGRGRPTLGRALDEGRVWARERLTRALAEASSHALLRAMLLGDRAGLGPETYRVLRSAGLVHLVAISGLHVGLIVMALLGVLKRTRIPPPVSCTATSIALACFGFVVGGRASVARAVSGASLMLLGRVIHRDGNALNTVGAIAGALVLFRPSFLWDPGFRLSFLAAAGILLMASPIARRLPLPRPLALSLGVTMAAYVSTVPVVAWHFGRVAPAALVANLAAVPLCGWILGSGCATIVLEPIPGLGPLAARSAEAGVAALMELARIAAAPSWSSWRVAAPAPWLMGAYYLLICFQARLGSRPERSRLDRNLRRCALLGLATCLAQFHLTPFPGRPAASMMEVVVADVGQAQSVLVRGPKGSCVVVDAAGTSGGRFDAGERVVAPLLSRHGCRRIDVLVLTHDHDDHAGGALAILREFEVGELWYGAGTHLRPRVRRIREEARARGAATVMVRRGLACRRADLEVEVLHPNESGVGLDVNNRSVVLRVSAGGRRLLIVGDLETEGERSLLAGGVDPGADVLVVGHHGADGGTSPDFVTAARPAIAAISVGARNRFGHPSPRVVELLAAEGVTVYRTDRDGSILLRAGPTAWRVFPAKASVERDGDRDEAREEDHQQ